MKILLFLLMFCLSAFSMEIFPYVFNKVYNNHGQEFTWVKNNTPHWLNCHIVSKAGAWPFKVAPWGESRWYPFTDSKYSERYCR